MTPGLPDYQALKRELGNPDSARLIFYAFDLLHLNGAIYDSSRWSSERKAALEKLLKNSAPTLTYAEHDRALQMRGVRRQGGRSYPIMLMRSRAWFSEIPVLFGKGTGFGCVPLSTAGTVVVVVEHGDDLSLLTFASVCCPLPRRDRA